METGITRRDFVNGIGVAIGASMLPGCADRDTPAADAPYPPALTGLRGAHPGSFEVAHAAVQGRTWPSTSPAEHYDLVVVGAGISGLAAACFYRRDVDPRARILVLDNHDDFGGHARRNEFTCGGQSLLGFGGTMLVDGPRAYPAVAKQLLRDVGFDVETAVEDEHSDLLESLRMGSGSFFDKETFGADFLATGGRGYTEAMSRAPLSADAHAQLQRLFDDQVDYLAGKSPAERLAIVSSTTWREYLATYGGFGAEALAFVQKWPHGAFAIGADALPSLMAWGAGYPGFAGMDLGIADRTEAEDRGPAFRFPDGNASIARLLVRRLVPGVTQGGADENIVTADFDYGRLDRDGNDVRIRLNSTVVNLGHKNGNLDGPVDVTYVRDNEALTVSGDNVVWAGYHAMLPYVCQDLPAVQASACRESVRAPLVYTSVLLRSWQSLAELGVERVYCPGSFYHSVRLTHPVSNGAYRYAGSPADPVVLHMQHIPTTPGLPAVEQFRAGRRILLQTPFDTFEREILAQLGRMFGAGGLQPARDVAAITVNRWPHGYAYSTDAASGDVAWWPKFWPHERRPWVDARATLGRIAVAGTDAASYAMTEAAIEQAHRAVQSLS